MIRAILVEDSATFRQSLKDALQSRFPSMEIMEAGDGIEALQKIEATPPDIVFMDIKLPGENGLVLTRRIKAQHPDMVVIVLTSYDQPEYREAAFQYKANYFLAKTSSTNEIVDTVKSVIEEVNKKE
jgi:DNA-binding NarL/FixJ family response regulator